MGTESAAESGTQKADRVVKKRASHACRYCRGRKIKCDVVKSGVPCPKCESEGIECVVIESRRARKYRLEKRRLDGLISLPPLAYPRPAVTTDPEPAPPTAQVPAQHVIEQQYHATSEAPSTPNIPIQSPAVSSAHSLARFSERYGSLTSPGQTPKTPKERPSIVDLPVYIRPILPSVRAEDVDLLERQGALTLPHVELRDQLLRCFVLYVYPFMPIVDLEDLFHALEGHEDAPRISLTLFQAIMFAGTAFVDLHLLLDAGYANRRAARCAYYRKLKILYDLDWDEERIPLIQSLLLANHWYVSQNDQKDPWHWTGICISIATSIGVNQTVTYNNRDPRTRCLWRRIWWSCVMRDRIIAASGRRPIRIKDEDINLSPLTLGDFDMGPISTCIPALRDCPVLQSRTVRQHLAEMCIAQVNVLLCMGHIIQGLYDLCVFPGDTCEVTMLYKPRTSHIDLQQISMLQDQLDQWYRSLPVSCWLSPSVNTLHPDGTTEDVLFVHRSVLRMIYLMAIEHLNRPQMLLRAMSANSTSKVQEAAERIADMYQRLQERDLIRFLPPLSVGFMLFSLAAFLVEIKRKGQKIRDLPGQQFHCCVRALWQLREVWPIADYACFLIGQMISKSEIGDRPTDSSNREYQMHGGGVPLRKKDHSDQEVIGQKSFAPGSTPAEPLAPGTGTTGVDPDPVLYSWTDADFERQYGIMGTGAGLAPNGQPLPTDFGFPEIEDPFEFFEDNILGFEPSRTTH